MKARTKILRCHGGKDIRYYKTCTYDDGEVIIWRPFEITGVKYDHTTLVKKKNSYELYGWQLHRAGGPALISSYLGGKVQWWLKGDRYYKTAHYCQMCGYNDMKTMQWVLKYGDVLPNKIDQL